MLAPLSSHPSQTNGSARGPSAECLAYFVRRCRRCGGTGHNARTCTATPSPAPAAVAVAPAEVSVRPAEVSVTPPSDSAELVAARAELVELRATHEQLRGEYEAALDLVDELDARAAVLEERLKRSAPPETPPMAADAAFVLERDAWRELAIVAAIRASGAKPPPEVFARAKRARAALRSLGIDSETGRPLTSTVRRCP